MTTVRTRPMLTTRDRILDAAERLLARIGYKKTTMEDIAREVGPGKRTLYLHFASKESLRPAYMARRARYFAAEVQVVADLLAEGRRLGAFACDDPEATRTPCSWRPTRCCPTVSPPGSWASART